MFYIFDKNGTLARSKVEGEFAVIPEQQELYRDVLPKLESILANSDNTIFALAVNMPDVAFGRITMEEATDLVNDVVRQISGTLGVFDPHHPEGTVPPYNRESDSRKPAPGMILFLMEQVGAPPELTTMVSDNPLDEEAAKAAGVNFIWADEFFGRHGGTLPG